MEVREAFRSRAGRGVRRRHQRGHRRPERPQTGVRQGQGRDASEPFGDGPGWLQVFYCTHSSSRVMSQGDVPAAGILVWGLWAPPSAEQCPTWVRSCDGCRKCVHRHTTHRSQVIVRKHGHALCVFISSLFSPSPLTLWDLPLGEAAALGTRKLATHWPVCDLKDHRVHSQQSESPELGQSAWVGETHLVIHPSGFGSGQPDCMGEGSV